MKKTVLTAMLMALALVGTAAVPAFAACVPNVVQKDVDNPNQFKEDGEGAPESLSPTSGGTYPYTEYRSDETPFHHCDPTA